MMQRNPGIRYVKLAIILFLLILSSNAYAAAWNFAVFSDTQDSDGGSGVNTQALTAVATDIVNNRNCAFVLSPGDNIEGETGSGPQLLATQYQTLLTTLSAVGLKVAGSSGSGLVYYPVEGNHNTYSNLHSNFYAEWANAFPTLPQNGPTTDYYDNSEVGFTYSFTYDNSLFLGVDEYLGLSHTVNQDWVNATLANSTSTHVFAFGHEPAYRGDHSDCLGDHVAERDAFLTSLYNAGGNFYFCGHDHFIGIARVYDGNPSSGGTQDFYQVIDGTAGGDPRTFNGVYNSGSHSGDYAVTDLYHDGDPTEHYSYMIVTVDGNLIWLKAYGTESLATVNWQLLYSLVASGTLQTDSGNFSSSATNDAEIVFNQSFDGTYSGALSGVGNLTKSGSGTLTLSGTNTYNGTTTVSAGTLSVTGSSSSTAVTVNVGAILEGTGTVKSITNYGTVKPGNSVGTLNLNGAAFTQSSTGGLEIEVASSSSFDKLIGASSASLDGTIKTITTGNYTAGTTLSGVIQTTGGITGNFSTLDTRITPTLFWDPQVNGNNVDLVATRDYDNVTLTAGFNSNQQSVAAMMQAEVASASGDLLNVFSAIDTLSSSAAVADAYAQISPEKLSGITSVAFTNAGVQVNNIQSRAYALRTGENRGFAFNQNNGAFSGDLFAGRLFAYEGEDLARLVSKNGSGSSDESDLGFFINGEGNFGDQDTTDTQPGFHYSAGGITAGIDRSFSQNVVGGISLGYSRTDSELGGSGGNVNADSLSCGLYGVYYRGNFYLNGASSITFNYYDTVRQIDFASIRREARASTKGKQCNLFLGTGYDYHYNKLTHGPTITVKYSNLWIESFSESGADSLDLEVDDQHAESCQLGLGWRAQYALKWRDKYVSPYFDASYQHEYANDGRAIQARLKGGSNVFQVNTDGPTRDFALLGCGLGVKLSKDLDFSAGYSIELGQENYVAQSISGNLRFSF